MDEFARATAKPNQGDAVTSTETPAAPAKKQAGTRYVVLEKRQGDGVWKQRGNPILAPSAEMAIRTIAEKIEGDDTSEYVAVPARSWNPVKVKIETRSVVTLEDA